MWETDSYARDYEEKLKNAIQVYRSEQRSLAFRFLSRLIISHIRGFSNLKLGFLRPPTHLVPLITLLRNNRNIDVVDLGGGGGDNLLQISNFIDQGFGRWVCIDNSNLANLGKRIFQEEKIELKVEWANSVSEIDSEQYVLLLVGVIQYLPDLSREISSCKTDPSFIFISRTLFAKNYSVKLHKAKLKHVKENHLVPYRIYNLDQLSRELRKIGYELIQTSEVSSHTLEFVEESIEGHYANLVFQRI